jgi:hypothetical protein
MLLPGCHGRRRFEGCDEVRSTARCQVSVSHRHVDRAVSQPSLDLIQGDARDCELAREAVASRASESLADQPDSMHSTTARVAGLSAAC